MKLFVFYAIIQALLLRLILELNYIPFHNYYLSFPIICIVYIVYTRKQQWIETSCTYYFASDLGESEEADRRFDVLTKIRHKSQLLQEVPIQAFKQNWRFYVPKYKTYKKHKVNVLFFNFNIEYIKLISFLCLKEAGVILYSRWFYFFINIHNTLNWQFK